MGIAHKGLGGANAFTLGALCAKFSLCSWWFEFLSSFSLFQGFFNHTEHNENCTQRLGGAKHSTLGARCGYSPMRFNPLIRFIFKREVIAC